MAGADLRNLRVGHATGAKPGLSDQRRGSNRENAEKGIFWCSVVKGGTSCPFQCSPASGESVMSRRRVGGVAAVAASVLLGVSGCETYAVSVVSDGGVDYLEAAAVGLEDNVVFVGFLPEFFDFQLNGDGSPLLDADNNWVPAADGEAWVDDFTTIVPAFLTAYPVDNELAVEEFSGDLNCSPPITRSGGEVTMEVTDFCADFLEVDTLLAGFVPFMAPFAPMTEVIPPVVGGVVRLDLSEAQSFCGLTVMAMEVPYADAELDALLSNEFDPATLADERALAGHLVSFVEEAENATVTNSYFIECDDEDAGGGGGGGTTVATQPVLAKTGTDADALLWGSVFGGFLVSVGLAAMLISRRRMNQH